MDEFGEIEDVFEWDTTSRVNKIFALYNRMMKKTEQPSPITLRKFSNFVHPILDKIAEAFVVEEFT